MIKELDRYRWSISGIVQQTGYDRKTVCKILAQPLQGKKQPRKSRVNKLESYKNILKIQNWAQSRRFVLLNLRPRMVLHPLGLELDWSQIAEQGVHPLLPIDVIQEAPNLALVISLVHVAEIKHG